MTNKEKGKEKGDNTTSTIHQKSYRRKLLEKEAWKQSSKYLRTCKSYENAIRLAQEDWKLSIDGIVTALRYNATKQHFIAKVNYTKDGSEKEEKMIIDDDWIVDVYGYKIMSKLVDRGSNLDFIQCPKTKRGTLAMVHIDGEKTVK
jgi:ribosomal protein L2